MAAQRNPLFHESVFYSLPAAIVASALSSALVMWQTGAAVDKVLSVFLPNAGIFLALWLWNWKPWKSRSITAIPYEKEPLPAKVVVAMVSKGAGSQTARVAVEYHKDSVENVWLITTPLAEDDARAVKRDLETVKPGIVVQPFGSLRNSHTIDEVKTEIERIRRLALKLEGVSERDVICDFTGLTKQASAGMVLACARRQARLQYVRAAESDERGRAIRPAKPVEVEVAYAITAEADEAGL